MSKTKKKDGDDGNDAAKDEGEIHGKVWVGLDLGGTKMLAKVFTDDWVELGSYKNKTEGHRGKSSGLKRMAKTIEQALNSAGVGKEHVAGIGVGVPGPLNPSTGVILEAPNLGWKNAPVKEFLENAIGAPTAVCNDVDSGVYGEYAFGAAQGARCVVGLFPGTGIGGGAVLDGKLIEGVGISCMEVGHIPLFPNWHEGVSLEEAASRLAISQAAAAAAYRGQAPWLLKECGTDIANIRSSKLAAAIKEGDEEIERIVRNAAGLLGIGAATVIQLLAPEIIVLGGGLVEAMADLYVEEVTKAANRAVLPSFRGTFQVVPAALGDDAGVKGAAAWARKRFGS